MDEPDVLADAKAALRRRVRARRAALAAPRRAAASAAICRLLDELDDLASARTVMLYGASSEEVDVSAYADALRSRGARTFYPRVAGDDLDVVEVTDGTVFDTGFRGILEPQGHAVDVRELDAVVVPGIAFDAAGRRLGQGKGYYDRLLPHLDGPRVAVGFACQLVDDVPTGPHDQRVDVVVTDEGIHRTHPPRLDREGTESGGGS